VTCWSERREQRWGIRDICNQFSESSSQKIPSVESGDFTTEPRSPPQHSTDHSPFVLPIPPVQQPAEDGFLRRGENSRPQTVPIPNGPTPKRRFTFPTIFRAGRGNEPRADQPSQGGISQKTTILSRGRNKLQVLVKTLAKFVRSGKSSGTGGRPSKSAVSTDYRYKQFSSANDGTFVLCIMGL